MRKIRGNTVGTTMSPEKLADKIGGGGDPTALNEHIENTENPHGVTAAQAGAAPAGFGLGESKSFTENWNRGYNGAFIRGLDGSPDGTMWYGLNCINGSSDSCASQIAFSQNAGNLTTEVRRTRNSAGTWGQWEYVNPPMDNGVEYRTIERFNGKAVYKKLEDGVLYWRTDGSETWNIQPKSTIVVTVSETAVGARPIFTPSHTSQQILDAVESGCAVILKTLSGDYVALTTVDKFGNEATFETFDQATVYANGEAFNALYVYTHTIKHTAFSVSTVTLPGKGYIDAQLRGPDMYEGIEYPASERFMGKEVYTKLINCGCFADLETAPGELNPTLRIPLRKYWEDEETGTVLGPEVVRCRAWAIINVIGEGDSGNTWEVYENIPDSNIVFNNRYVGDERLQITPGRFASADHLSLLVQVWYYKKEVL